MKLIALAVGSLLLTSPLASAGMLVDLYRQALDEEPRFAAAQAQREAALQSGPLLRSEILPTLRINGYAARLRDDSEQSRFIGFQDRLLYASTWQLGIELHQPLLDWAVFARLRRIDAQAARAELVLLDARQQLMLDLVERYLNWLAAVDELGYLHQQQAAIAQQQAQLQTQVETGYATAADYQLVTARKDLAAAQTLQAAAALREAREAIRELVLAVPAIPNPLAARIDTPVPEPADPDIWVQRALNNNPELRRAALDVELSQAAISEERGRYYPQLGLELAHRYIDTDEVQLGREAENSQIVLQLNVPLYAGGATSARVAAADAGYRRNALQRDALQRSTARQTRNAYDGIVTGVQQLAAAEQAVRSQTVALEAVEGGRASGLRTVAEVLDARQQLFRANRDEAAARYAYLRSVLRLKAIVGSLVDADLLLLDRQLVAQ